MKVLKSITFIGLVATIANILSRTIAVVIILGVVYSFATKDFSAIHYVLAPDGPVVKLYESLYDKIPQIISAVKTAVN